MLITIISWNVNGLRQRYKMHEFLPLFRHNPEIVCIQETKTPIEEIPGDLKKLYGYRTYFSGIQPESFTGVALFTRIHPLFVKYGFGDAPYDSKGRIIVADFNAFVLLNVYFPLGRESVNNIRNNLEVYDAFLAYVRTLNNERRRVIVCGNFGIAHTDLDMSHPMKKPSQKIGISPQERDKIDQLIRLGFVDAFRLFNQDPGHYTWWPNGFKIRDRNQGWRVDYFFVNELMKPLVKRFEILSFVEGSDHCPVLMEVDLAGSDSRVIEGYYLI